MPKDTGWIVPEIDTESATLATALQGKAKTLLRGRFNLGPDDWEKIKEKREYLDLGNPESTQNCDDRVLYRICDDTRYTKERVQASKLIESFPAIMSGLCICTNHRGDDARLGSICSNSRGSSMQGIRDVDTEKKETAHTLVSRFSSVDALISRAKELEPGLLQDLRVISPVETKDQDIQEPQCTRGTSKKPSHQLSNVSSALAGMLALRQMGDGVPVTNLSALEQLVLGESSEPTL